jgi:cellobiose-specific phosphotransferase system component IIA
MNKNAYAFALVIAGAVLFSGLSLILTSPPTFTLAAETVQSNSHQAASNMITVSMTTEGGGEGGQAQFHLGEAIKALQGGDTDGAMMHMEEADNTLEAGEAKMHLGEAIKALQGGDTDGAMTHLELAQ